MPRVYILRRFPSCHYYIGQNHPILISSNHAMLAEQFGREGGAGGWAVWSKTALGWLDYDATSEFSEKGERLRRKSWGVRHQPMITSALSQRVLEDGGISAMQLEYCISGVAFSVGNAFLWSRRRIPTSIQGAK